MLGFHIKNDWYYCSAYWHSDRYFPRIKDKGPWPCERAQCARFHSFESRLQLISSFLWKLDHYSLQEISCLDTEEQRSSADIEEDFTYSGHSVSVHTKIDNIARLSGRHFPMKNSSSDWAQSKRQTKMCRVCYARGLRTVKGTKIKTVWVCADCPSKPGLHVDEGCFKIYHTDLDLAHSAQWLDLLLCMYSLSCLL
jgi:hypothetical protein